MSKHTPGPWEVEDNFIQTSEFMICEVYSKEDYAKHPDVQQDIVNKETGKANAHLIAAAPELLEACRKAHECVVVRAGCRNSSEKDAAEDRKEIDLTIKLLEQAIAKAELVERKKS